MKLLVNPEVRHVFDNYPAAVLTKMLELRDMVIETAEETEGVDLLEETLKWGEPSYIAKRGSTLRMDWKPGSPETCAMYFKCTSRLVETFRAIFGDTFEYEGNRAIVFRMSEPLPKEELKTCIRAALTYHKVKHLPTLGI